ncbi:MAG: type II toxin-antitoxin system RelE/ParE family toxin [Daejeonella sp.]|uniref:type II toxin-antitoxin system RelE/ParE family toxin n=1 Tax=Daejeonella sp. JGW-45 TaxID=3034148 RepID=UPI0023EDBA94|nr:type II toxin-antitoxin system RelE/ParE family toxin [Daejeonella sp. JGW-45]
MNSYDILVLDEAKAFIKAMPKSAQKKLVKAMDYVRIGSIKKDYFKKLTGTDDIWEFRIADSEKWYRILAFFMKANDGPVTVIVATHGFEKEGAKTPSQQIGRAERIKKEFQSVNK